MINRFRSYLVDNELCREDDPVMLAVSGGIDSVVMTDLFITSGYRCMLLHCNFGLRGDESEGDEAFVRSLAARYDAPVFVKRFDCEGYAEENGVSIQMAARELRYDWFDKVSDDQKIDRIATAHNLNDSVETVFLNMARGTGIRGITGIPAHNGKYIRPLLFSSREEITDYARAHQLEFREDSSNVSRKYQRNIIRHDLIPLMESLNPAFISTMGENISRFNDAHKIYREQVDHVKQELFSDMGTHLEINLVSLKKMSPLGSWLYELFSDYGYSMDQCLNIREILNSASGKQFISPTHRLYKDRDRLLLFETKDASFQRYYIDAPGSDATLPFPMDIEVLDRDSFDDIPDDPNIAFLDHDLVTFPLMLRKWQHGDYFFPLGMDQMKKLSDFFIDNKVPVPIKKHTWILTSGNKIAWIMGMRIDNRFRISRETKKILKLQIYDRAF